jgi:hypothetical protein
MKEIIEKEAIRRTALFQQAIELIAPITQTVKTAKENKAIAGLHLYPPDRRGMTTVRGLLLCRTFHYSGDRRRRRYVLSISPSQGTIFIALEEGYDMSEDDLAQYEHAVDVVWENTYYQDKRPTIDHLRQMIEEALITDAVEIRAKLGPRGV